MSTTVPQWLREAPRPLLPPTDYDELADYLLSGVSVPELYLSIADGFAPLSAGFHQNLLDAVGRHPGLRAEHSNLNALALANPRPEAEREGPSGVAATAQRLGFALEYDPRVRDLSILIRADAAQVTERRRMADAVPEPEAVQVSEGVPEPEAVQVSEGVPEPEAVQVSEGVPEPEAVTEQKITKLREDYPALAKVPLDELRHVATINRANDYDGRTVSKVYLMLKGELEDCPEGYSNAWRVLSKDDLALIAKALSGFAYSTLRALLTHNKNVSPKTERAAEAKARQALSRRPG